MLVATNTAWEESDIEALNERGLDVRYLCIECYRNSLEQLCWEFGIEIRNGALDHGRGALRWHRRY